MFTLVLFNGSVTIVFYGVTHTKSMNYLWTFLNAYSGSFFLVLFSMIIALSVLLGFLLIRYRALTQTLTYLLRGKKASSLEDIIITHTREISDIKNVLTDLSKQNTALRTTLTKSIHKKGIVRYNPFKDLGGDQSFAIALLDGTDSGIVISSLHTREGTRIYAKPIINSLSKKYKLSEEEELAITDAQMSIK